MPLPKVSFIRTDGNLRTPIAGLDYISGLLFDVPVAPGTTSLNDVFQIFSLRQAEELGVTPYSADPADNPYESGLPHLHISEFFRLFPSGSLYIMFSDCSANFEALHQLQRVAQGAIRQVAVWTPQKLWTDTGIPGDPYTINLIPDLNNIGKALADKHQPLSIFLSANTAGIEADMVTTSMTAMPSILLGDYPRVSVFIGQGNTRLVRDIQLLRPDHESVGWVGAALATTAIAGVGESIAWVGKFNLIGGAMNSVAFGFGDLTIAAGEFVSNLPYESIAEAQLDEISDKGYIFPRKFTDYDGTFVSKDQTCSTGDFRMINRNRTIDKSRREIRKVLLPRLNSPIDVDPSNGQLSTATQKVFKALVTNILEQMQNNGEISGFVVNIPPNQNLLETDTLKIQYRLIPKGVASFIEVEEGFAVSIATAALGSPR